MQLLMGDIGVRYYFFDGDKIMGVGVDREITPILPEQPALPYDRR